MPTIKDTHVDRLFYRLNKGEDPIDRLIGKSKVSPSGSTPVNDLLPGLQD